MDGIGARSRCPLRLDSISPGITGRLFMGKHLTFRTVTRSVPNGDGRPAKSRGFTACSSIADGPDWPAENSYPAYYSCPGSLAIPPATLFLVLLIPCPHCSSHCA